MVSLKKSVLKEDSPHMMMSAFCYYFQHTTQAQASTEINLKILTQKIYF